MMPLIDMAPSFNLHSITGDRSAPTSETGPDAQLGAIGKGMPHEAVVRAGMVHTEHARLGLRLGTRRDAQPRHERQNTDRGASGKSSQSPMGRGGVAERLRCGENKPFR